MPSSGPGRRISHGGYEAETSAVGAGLRSLRHDGRDLVVPYDADEIRPFSRGAVLAPWPNRVGGGRWSWRGEDLQLAINEPDLGHALHGLVLWVEWRVTEHRDESLTLATTIWPQPGYPFLVELAMRWAVGPDGLTGELTAQNRGDEPAPYGCSIHPYLVAPTGRLDEWTLHVPAARELQVDDLMLPSTLGPLASSHDFRVARPIGDAQIDNAYTEVAFDAAGEAAVTLVDGHDDGVQLTFGTATPWVQVCTADFPGGQRAGLAVEPMTCPPDALRSGEDLVVLQPGAEHRAWWRISVAVT
ncbi:MAG TPA: aldose 1-epimerase family protein [Microthrixaceae bacterium]|nr:aldose 1-epimerase family protein [Microthrixaceae bacterium]